MYKEFVPYEIALQLKEKGFVWGVFGRYYQHGSLNNISLFTDMNTDAVRRRKVILICDAPLYQQVIRWFREVHGLHIMVSHWIKQPVDDEIWDDCYQSFINGDAMDVRIYQTYDEALNYGINEALKKI